MSVLYLLRSNRALLRAQAGKVIAEGEETNVSSAVALIREMRAERQELKARLDEALQREVTTREEREKLWAERRELQQEIEVRDRHIRYLRRVLHDAGIEEPPESAAAGPTKPPPG